jgi:transporter family-2 protein
MKAELILVAALGGAIVPLQAAINAGLVRYGAAPPYAAAISAGITTLSLGVVGMGFMRQPLPRLDMLAHAPPWVWSGGLLGGFFLVAALMLAPRLGTAVMIASVIAGQMICSLVLDHFGWLGLPQQPVTPGRVAGALAICAGVALIRFF